MSNFTVSDSRKADFIYSLKQILIAPPPLGVRGNFDFEKRFQDTDKLEFFYFKHALIIYILKEEKVSGHLQKDFKKAAELLLERQAVSDTSFKKSSAADRLDFYSDKLPRIFGKDRFSESRLLEDELYRFIYQKLFSKKYTGRSDDDWERWFSAHGNELEIIPQFIVCYHEAVLTVLTLFDESLWTEHL